MSSIVETSKRYAIGPGLIVSLFDALLIQLVGKKIKVTFSDRSSLYSKFPSDEQAQARFSEIREEMNPIFSWISKDVLICKCRIATIYHTPTEKGVFCVKTIGETVVLTFTNSYLMYNYYFDSEEEATQFIDTLSKEISTNKMMSMKKMGYV